MGILTNSVAYVTWRFKVVLTNILQWSLSRVKSLHRHLFLWDPSQYCPQSPVLFHILSIVTNSWLLMGILTNSMVYVTWVIHNIETNTLAEEFYPAGYWTRISCLSANSVHMSSRFLVPSPKYGFLALKRTMRDLNWQLLFSKDTSTYAGACNIKARVTLVPVPERAFPESSQSSLRTLLCSADWKPKATASSLRKKQNNVSNKFVQSKMCRKTFPFCFFSEGLAKGTAICRTTEKNKIMPFPNVFYIVSSIINVQEKVSIVSSREA